MLRNMSVEEALTTDADSALFSLRVSTFIALDPETVGCRHSRRKVSLNLKTRVEMIKFSFKLGIRKTASELESHTCIANLIIQILFFS